MRHHHSAIKLILIAFGCLLAAPAAATAATSCDYSGGLLEVRLPAERDGAVMSVLSTGTISVRPDGADDPLICTGVGGPPSVSNTNVISISNTGSPGENAVFIGGPSRFAPGASSAGENGGTPEIEISVNLNNAPGSELAVGGQTLGVPIRFGASGINTNAVPEEIQPDADILPAGVPALTGLGDGTTGGTLRADGGLGTGGALTTPILLFGGGDDHELVGGQAGDRLISYGGSDRLSGEGGDDVLDPGADLEPDVIDGGPGTDMVLYDALSGITIDLAIAGPQDTRAAGNDSLTGVENVTGTEFGDVLRGDAGANRLFGGPGDDVLDGRGASDTLMAAGGADMLDVRDGVPDRAECGDGADTVTADAPGVDVLIGCETVVFPVAPATVFPVAPGPGPARDVTAPGISGLRLSRPVFAPARRGRSFTSARRRIGTTVSYRLSEAASVRFTLERRVRGRYRKLKGSFIQRGRRGANRFRLTGRWRGRRLKSERYRLVATATDAARNRGTAKRVRLRISPPA